MTNRKPRAKTIHRGKHVDRDGNVSALCFVRKRPINLRKATWTLRDDAVTCKRCLVLIQMVREAQLKHGGVL